MPAYTNMYGTRHHLQQAVDSMDADDDDLEAYRNPPPTQRREPMSETGEERDETRTFQLQPYKRMKPLEPIPENKP